jgi:hypothetical protein
MSSGWDEAEAEADLQGLILSSQSNIRTNRPKMGINTTNYQYHTYTYSMI